MFCPDCGAQVSGAIKFCKQCGVNLRAVQEAMVRPDAPGALDWNRAFAAEIHRQRSATPEEKRLNEIKGGVITSAVGLGVTVFLFFLMNAVAAGVPPHKAEIVRHIYLAGLIPFLIGLAITFNGIFISRRLVELKRQQLAAPADPLPPVGADTGEIVTPAMPPAGDFSVTEQTTTRLGQKAPAPPRD
jgi:hypothetical protein